jgi:hypothetical protein
VDDISAAIFAQREQRKGVAFLQNLMTVSPWILTKFYYEKIDLKENCSLTRTHYLRSPTHQPNPDQLAKLKLEPALVIIINKIGY